MGKILENAESVLKSQKLFTSNVDHELRNSLSTIHLGAESVLEDLESGRDSGLSKEKSEELIHTMKGDLSELKYVANVIKNLSVMASYQYDRDKMELSRVNLNELLKDLCGSVARQTAEAKNIEVTFKAGSQSYILGNESALKQMITNILKNAIYYTPKGGSVTASLANTKNRVVMSIVDSGSGISKEDLAYVLEPFYRSSTPGKSKNKKGSGLGLAIVAEIAKRHGAEIRLENAVKKGTNVSVSFPAIAPVKK